MTQCSQSQRIIGTVVHGYLKMAINQATSTAQRFHFNKSTAGAAPVQREEIHVLLKKGDVILMSHQLVFVHTSHSHKQARSLHLLPCFSLMHMQLQ